MEKNYIEKFTFESIEDLITSTLFHLENYANKNQKNEYDTTKKFISLFTGIFTITYFNSSEQLEKKRELFDEILSLHKNYVKELPTQEEVIESYIDSLSGYEIANFYRLSRELFDNDSFGYDQRTYKQTLKEVMQDREKWSRLKRTVCVVRSMRDWEIPDITGYTE